MFVWETLYPARLSFTLEGETSVLGCRFFLFNTFSSGLQSFCWEISWKSFVFLHTDLKVLFIITSYYFNYYMSRCRLLWVQLAKSSLRFLDLDVSFSSAGMFAAITLSNFLSSSVSSFWDPYIANVVVSGDVIEFH